MRLSFCACAASALFPISTVLFSSVLISSSASGAIINPGMFALSNHSDDQDHDQDHDQDQDSPYGLRLDELVDVTGDHNPFTFDFDHDQSSMKLTYDGSTIVISGLVWGGLDKGGSRDPDYATLWEVFFKYDAVVQALPDDDLIVFTPTVRNTGWIKPIADGVVNPTNIPLFDEIDNNVQIGLSDQDHDGFTFRLGNENDGNDHHEHNPVSGWGWVNHTVSLNHTDAYEHESASAWQFTLNELSVPEPTTGPLSIIGFCVVMLLRRRDSSSV